MKLAVISHKVITTFIELIFIAINITSIDAEHDRSMREVYGLDRSLRE